MKKSEEKKNKKPSIKGKKVVKKDERVDILDESKTKEIKKKKAVKGQKDVSDVKAKARFLKISPKKVKLVVDLVRGLNIDEAVAQLSFINKGAARPVLKLLNSAIANAEHNFKLNREDLYIKHIVANQGPTLHRWKPAAFGRAHPIRKRTTHLEIILGLKEGAGTSVTTEATKKKFLPIKTQESVGEKK